MKSIVAVRGASINPMVLANLDKYDSIFKVYDDNKIVDTFNYCNTDPSIRYQDKSGILYEGTYGFICFNSPKRGPVLLLFLSEYLNQVNTMADIDENMMILPSLIPNPNHAGRKEMSDILVHKGGTSEWDWSAGCMTIFGLDWQKFINLFTIGEKGLFTLERGEYWKEGV
jgi:hypothetical protein